MSNLLIRWNPSGTHADVSRVDSETPVPASAHLLRPGESYYGIGYEEWARRLGGTADVLHLQFAADRARAPQPPLRIAARVNEGGWQAELAQAQPAPAGAAYGFSTGARLVPCDRRQLIAQCVGAPETPRVWTPDTPELVSPEEVPFLVEALRDDRLRAAGRSSTIATAVLLSSAAIAWGAGMRSGWMILCALAAAWLAVTLFEYRQARSTAPQAFVAAREEFRHDVWIGSRRAAHTEIMILLILAVAMAESFGLRQAIDAAGLVKPAVRDGEFWRLLTAPLLHGGVLHLAMNGLALWSLGPLVEAHSRRAFLPLIFLVSALGGGLLSLVLLPETTSVGASGGILGLAGYLLVLGFRRRRSLPAGFVQRLGLGILATAVFGLVGYAWVDNATHLGGLLGGIAMALLPGDEPRGAGIEVGDRRAMVGYVALAVLVVSAIGAVAAIYLRLSGTTLTLG